MDPVLFSTGQLLPAAFLPYPPHRPPLPYTHSLSKLHPAFPTAPAMLISPGLLAGLRSVHTALMEPLLPFTFLT